MARGLLISQVYQKSLTLSYAQTQAIATVSYMSSDIDGAATGIAKFHETWADFLYVAAGTYLLGLQIGWSAIFILVPSIGMWNETPLLLPIPAFLKATDTYRTTYLAGNVYAGQYLGNRAPNTRQIWDEIIKLRVTRTAAMLSQLKAIKMVGLDKLLLRPIVHFCRIELEHASISGEWLAIKLATSKLKYNLGFLLLSPILHARSRSFSSYQRASSDHGRLLLDGISNPR